MNPRTLYKIEVIFITLFMFTVTVRCQKPIEKTKEKIEVKTPTNQEEEDWQKVKRAVLKFCDYPEECERFYDSTFLDQRIFEDSIHLRNLRFVRDFLYKYPKSDHYFDALKFYFSFLVEPRFINTPLTENKKNILNQKTEYVKGKINMSHNYQQFRTLPYNHKLKEKWLQEGDSIAQKFIDSEESIDKKAFIEVAVLGRKKRMAKLLYEFISPYKKEEENEYWFLFDNFFWKEFIEEIDQLIFKYPNYSKWPVLIDQFINSTTKDFLSPKLKEPLWEHFKEISSRPELFEKHPVIAEVHDKAIENIKAIEELNKFDENKPLQIEFTSMDGQKIDLKDYREKVVLIDFWSIRCAPCIQEMPHIRALYNKYKKQGFEVIGISSEGDVDRQRVLDITKKQGANWPQLLDGSSDVTVSYHSLYKIHALPTTWLLDKNGIIVDRQARGSRLEPLIKKYLESD